MGGDELTGVLGPSQVTNLRQENTDYFHFPCFILHLSQSQLLERSFSRSHEDSYIGSFLGLNTISYSLKLFYDSDGKGEIVEIVIEPSYISLLSVPGCPCR